MSSNPITIDSPEAPSDLAPHRSESRPLRVLQFISTLETGGAAKGTVELVHALEKRDDIEVRLCAIGNTHSLVDTSHLRHAPIDLGCSVHSRRWTLRRWRRIRRLVREFHPDIVHSHLWPTAREVAWAIRGLGLPHLVHIRDTPPSFVDDRWQSRLKKHWLRWTLNSPDTRFVAVSRAAREYSIRHLDLSPDRVSVIVNGIDITPFLNMTPCRSARPSEEIVIGTMARLSASKGLHHLIEACRLLAETKHSFRLRIAGEGTERYRLNDQATRAGLASRLQFLGNVNSIVDFLQSLDVFVFPSLAAEGLPRVLLEAMAAGLPVVTTDCEGVDDIAGLKQHGIVVPKHDAAALARGIEYFLNHPQERFARGRNAREAVRERHSIERVCDEVVGHCRATCNSHYGD